MVGSTKLSFQKSNPWNNFVRSCLWRKLKIRLRILFRTMSYKNQSIIYALIGIRAQSIFIQILYANPVCISIIFVSWCKNQQFFPLIFFQKESLDLGPIYRQFPLHIKKRWEFFFEMWKFFKKEFPLLLNKKWKFKWELKWEQ